MRRWPCALIVDSINYLGLVLIGLRATRVGWRNNRTRWTPLIVEYMYIVDLCLATSEPVFVLSNYSQSDSGQPTNLGECTRNGTVHNGRARSTNNPSNNGARRIHYMVPREDQSDECGGKVKCSRPKPCFTPPCSRWNACATGLPSVNALCEWIAVPLHERIDGYVHMRGRTHMTRLELSLSLARSNPRTRIQHTLLL